MVAREPAGVGGSPHNGRASAEVPVKPPTSGGMVTQWSLSPSRIRLYRSPMDEPAVRAGVRAAFDKLRAAYRELGGWRFPGYLDDPTMAYVGPWAWSEGDIQRHFANALAEEFPPEWVHVELPLRIGTRSDLPAQEQGAVRFARRNVPFSAAQPAVISPAAPSVWRRRMLLPHQVQRPPLRLHRCRCRRAEAPRSPRLVQHQPRCRALSSDLACALLLLLGTQPRPQRCWGASSWFSTSAGSAGALLPAAEAVGISRAEPHSLVDRANGQRSSTASS
jgi:hypothetical protein